MRNEISKLWLLGPPFAILLTLFVYYAQFRVARNWVDARFPWVKENIGEKLKPLDADAPRRVVVSKPSADLLPPESDQRPDPAAALPPPAPTYLLPDGRVDLEGLAADRAAWPKTVKLKKPQTFPAVVSGKVVGKVEVLAGAEVNLVAVEKTQLGVEYGGGGARVPVEDTDLPARLRR